MIVKVSEMEMIKYSTQMNEEYKKNNYPKLEISYFCSERRGEGLTTLLRLFVLFCCK
jgi:hypothetical protein